MSTADQSPAPPRATYRLQFHAGFRLRDAEALLPYLDGLGVSHLYASPLLQARAGSEHGYDLTDPTRLNPELGSEDDLAHLAHALRGRGLGLLLDIVPNHMSATRENPWWWSVLEFGRASPQAAWFDIDWRARGSRPEAAGRVVLPVLGARMATVLARGELQIHLAPDRRSGFISYFQRRFPLNAASLSRLPAAPLTPAALRHLLDQQHYLLIYWRAASQEINYRRFFAINELVGFRVEVPAAFAAAHALVGAWLRAGLVQGLRVDHIDGLYDPAAYLRSLQVLFAGQSDGDRSRQLGDATSRAGIRCRQSQPALKRPTGAAKQEVASHLETLRAEQASPADNRSPTSSDQRERPNKKWRATIWVEKILAPGESLPSDWPVEGTTGYDFLACLDRLQVDPTGYPLLLRGYQRFIRRHSSFAAVVYGKKRQAIRSFFPGEMRNLGQRAASLAHAAGIADLDAATVAHALIAVAASLPVYRTYLYRLEATPSERAALHTAVVLAHARAPELRPDALAWIEWLLSADSATGIPPARHSDWLRLLQRWQQYTAPIMAKGQEDAALYVYVPLASLNEVGGDPGQPRLAPADFHAAMTERQRTQPHTLNASSTHDTKRSEDVRARLNVLSELPADWNRALRQWARWNRPLRRQVDKRPVPDPNTEVLIYQTLVGVWPLGEDSNRPPTPEFVARIQAYMRKAVREAAVHTSWAAPRLGFESALAEFIAELLDPARSPAFLASLRSWVNQIAPAGARNSLAQLALKSLCPGIPDFYQGCELWNFSLVDPDNRRAVDFAFPKMCLSQWALAPPNPVVLLENWRDGQIKLWLTQRLLQVRRQRPWLRDAEYLAVPLAGAQSEHALAFRRRAPEGEILVVVPLQVAAASRSGTPSLRGWDWGGTRLQLPESAAMIACDLLQPNSHPIAHSELPLSALLQDLPVAVLALHPSRPINNEGQHCEPIRPLQ